MRLQTIAVLFLSVLPFMAESAVSIPAYTVTRTWSLPGDERWDYLNVDTAAARLFVSRAQYVQVMDIASGKLIGTIPDTDGVHGIALAPDQQLGFTSNGRANSVTVFDLSSLKTLDVIKIDGSKPDAIVYDAFSHRVLTFNGQSNNVTLIDPAMRKVVGNIDLPGNPEFAASNSTGRIFVNIEDKAELVSIDPVAMKIVATWPLPGCDSPSGLALDIRHQRSFSVCENHRMVILDTADGHRVSQQSIGTGPDAAAFDARRGVAFSSNGDGTLTVIHEDTPNHFRRIATVLTQPSARTMTIDTSTGRIFLAAAIIPTLSIPGLRPAPTPGSFRILEVGPTLRSAHRPKHGS